MRTEHLRNKSAEEARLDFQEALEVNTRFADGCPALSAFVFRVVEFKYISSATPVVDLCEHLANCSGLLWCEPGSVAFHSSIAVQNMAAMIVRCRPDLYRRCSVAISGFDPKVTDSVRLRNGTH